MIPLNVLGSCAAESPTFHAETQPGLSKEKGANWIVDFKSFSSSVYGKDLALAL